jgi:hypothetical protein
MDSGQLRGGVAALLNVNRATLTGCLLLRLIIIHGREDVFRRSISRQIRYH